MSAWGQNAMPPHQLKAGYAPDWLCHLATFINNDGVKKVAGQVTKPIIVVKICYKLLYVIQVVKIFDK